MPCCSKGTCKDAPHCVLAGACSDLMTGRIALHRLYICGAGASREHGGHESEGDLASQKTYRFDLLFGPYSGK